MVPAKPRDTIAQFLKEVERVYMSKQTGSSAAESIKCEQLFVEDHYEVDERYSVEECLGDMFRVIVVAKTLSRKVHKPEKNG